MMGEFIEQNRRMLRAYSVAARIIGWTLLLSPAIRIVLILLWSRLGEGPERYRPSLSDTLSLWAIGFVMFGVLVLGVGQLIRYVFETEYRPPWLLRHGVKILYLCAALSIVAAGVTIRMIFGSPADLPRQAQMLSTLSLVIPTLARALLLVGLGRILGRVMPVIEESKTLV